MRPKKLGRQAAKLIRGFWKRVSSETRIESFSAPDTDDSSLLIASVFRRKDCSEKEDELVSSGGCEAVDEKIPTAQSRKPPCRSPVSLCIDLSAQPETPGPSFKTRVKPFVAPLDDEKEPCPVVSTVLRRNDGSSEKDDRLISSGGCGAAKKKIPAAQSKKPPCRSPVSLWIDFSAQPETPGPSFKTRVKPFVAPLDDEKEPCPVVSTVLRRNDGSSEKDDRLISSGGCGAAKKKIPAAQSKKPPCRSPVSLCIDLRTQPETPGPSFKTRVKPFVAPLDDEKEPCPVVSTVLRRNDGSSEKDDRLISSGGCGAAKKKIPAAQSKKPPCRSPVSLWIDFSAQPETPGPSFKTRVKPFVAPLDDEKKPCPVVSTVLRRNDGSSEKDDRLISSGGCGAAKKKIPAAQSKKTTCSTLVCDCSAPEKTPLLETVPEPVQGLLHVAEAGGEDELEIQKDIEIWRLFFYEDYDDLCKVPPTRPFTMSKKDCNRQKNRYEEFPCYDETRVRLRPLSHEDEQASDYINASFMDGYKRADAFIATQGPLEQTFGDFWKMVWQEKVLIIVMTTRTKIGRFELCGQYWPLRILESQHYGNIRVRNLLSTKREGYNVTFLELLDVETRERRSLTHYMLTDWPQYGIPADPSIIFEVQSEVRSMQRSCLRRTFPDWTGHPDGPPVVVHSSAGVGRTGTYIALDICLSRLQDIGTVDIDKTVYRMRSQRAFSVDCREQYCFIYDAILEYIQSNRKIYEEYV